MSTSPSAKKRGGDHVAHSPVSGRSRRNSTSSNHEDETGHSHEAKKQKLLIPPSPSDGHSPNSSKSPKNSAAPSPKTSAPPSPKLSPKSSGTHGDQLEQLKGHSIVVADTGDFNVIKEYGPEDATTNPSLILQATQLSQYKPLIDTAISHAKEAVVDHEKNEEEFIDEIVDILSVLFGIEILKIVPGVVSTEVPARYSFDAEGSIAKAKKLIGLYEKSGVKRDRILIKMATTWEGCEAAKKLEKEGIHCNMTLLFSFCQAVAAAEAGATLVSPFVGRILDWYKKHHPDQEPSYVGVNDPGVQSVTKIYNYYKKFDYKTIIMAASFRNKGEILALTGCDKQTISPKLLAELKASSDRVSVHLSREKAKKQDIEKIKMNEKIFRWMLNEDQMASDKLGEGIRNFHADTLKLRDLIKQKLHFELNGNA